MDTERQIRETTLAQVMLELSKAAMEKSIKRYTRRFVPKYRAFNILQNNIEDVVQKSKQVWKLTYGLSTSEEVVQTPIEVGKEKEEEKGEDIEQDIVEGGMEMNIDTQAPVIDEKQIEKSVSDTQVLSASPQQETSAIIDIVKLKDVFETIAQNINPLIEDDLKKILVKSTNQEKLCENLVLVSVDEIEKADKAFVGEEKKTPETSTPLPQSTMVQPPLPIVVYHRKEKEISTDSTIVQSAPVIKDEPAKTNDKVETSIEQKGEIRVVEKDEAQSQIGQDVTPVPIVQNQGVTGNTEKEKDKTEESSLTTKPEEKLAIQALALLPESTTPPSQALQRLSIEDTPLQSSRPSPNTSNAEEVTSYGDASLDEEIVLPTIEQMGILQEALSKKKNQELLRREHRQRQDLIDIKDIFLDAFSLSALEEKKPRYSGEG